MSEITIRTHQLASSFALLDTCFQVDVTGRRNKLKAITEIGRFGKYHNTLCLSPPSPPQILHKHCGLTMGQYNSWDLQWSQEKTKTMLMQNLGGQTKSIMVFSEGAYDNNCRQ